MSRAYVLLPVLALLLSVPRVHAQELESSNLGDVFEDVFSQLLTERFSLSPGEHANHYLPAADLAAETLAPALNNLIASNISSFPLSSAVTGITFDFSSGQPVQVVESPGPIFAETAATLGKSNLVFGVNVTHLGFDQFRSINLDEMEFAFLHQDVGEPGRGDVLAEGDVVYLRPNLNLTANIWAFSGTYGVSPNLDIGIAVPFVSISMEGNTVATVDSYTLTSTGTALHFFGGDVNNPDLEDEVAYSMSTSGVGDVAVRAKYRFATDTATEMASLLDVRLPTGDDANFLGTGSMNASLLFVASRHFGATTPHLNLGYNYRGADFDSDEVEFAVGFDQRMAPGLSLAMDLLGEFDLNSFEAIHVLPGSESLTLTNAETNVTITQEVSLSNVPDRDNDNTVMASIGVRWAPVVRMQVLANILVPLTQTGLHSTFVPTVGVSAAF